MGKFEAVAEGELHRDQRDGEALAELPVVGQPAPAPHRIEIRGDGEQAVGGHSARSSMRFGRRAVDVTPVAAGGRVFKGGI